jgi:ferredoxin-like protein FixX
LPIVFTHHFRILLLQVKMDAGPDVQVILPHQEFHDDLETRLGRANGNIYHRQEGIAGIHDGQVMVRLKKKRYIVIDYSIVPNEHDFQVAATNPHITIPNGAGKQKCTTPECTKVGVPVCLYDSEPNEPSSLYLRAGLCFTCQRNLNEKRRTQRKRHTDDGMVHSPVLYAVGPGQKKIKLNGMNIDLTSDAIILNGHYGSSTKTTRDGYSFDEIGPDLMTAVNEASGDTHRLVHAISSNTTTAMGSSNHHHNHHTGVLSVEEVANAAVEATTGIISGAESPPHHSNHTNGGAVTSEDINVLYDKAFTSLSRSIFLLTQWKQSWDSAIAAAVAQETVGDSSLADAVASAAAVAAAATDGTDNISLLLAADQRKEGIGNKKGITSSTSMTMNGETSGVEHFEV